MIIPSVRNMRQFDVSLRTESPYVLLSEIHIGNLREFAARCHSLHKMVMVNIDLIGGFSADQAGLKLLHNFYKVDVAISSSGMKLNMAKAIGLQTMQRMFLLDSRSFDFALKSIQTTKVDAIEVLPGPLAPDFWQRIKDVRDVPLFAGGFIDSPEVVRRVQKARFAGVTTSEGKLWSIKLKQNSQ